jgi:trypsin
MQRLAVLVVLAATPALAGPDRPILGGTPATAGQFPPVVALEIGGGLCSGTLIAKDWVLTAAHCVTPMEVGLPDQAAVTQNMKVFLHTLDIRNPGPSVGATDTIPDPGFDLMHPGHNDSGLVKLAMPVTDIAPTPLNFDSSKAPVGTTVTMVGYGTTVSGGGLDTSGVEYTVQQTAVPCSSLTAPPGSTLTDVNLLCFNQTDGMGKCNGDSGGPSFAMIGGKLVEVGVTSFGSPGCTMVGADTRVDAEKAFITQHVTDLYCAADADCATGHECFANGCIVQPYSPGGLGASCTGNPDCESGSCAKGPMDGMTCTTSCTPGAAHACPAGLECTMASGAASCWPAPDDSGCCDASGTGASSLLLGVGVLTLALRRRRGERWIRRSAA